MAMPSDGASTRALGKAGLDQENHLNTAMSSYVWETKTGTIPPIGTYSKTALNAYDQTTFSGSGLVSQDRNGWSNDNALQVNYQRLYKHGYAYQMFYVFSRAMRVGGNAFRDGVIHPPADYAPGMLPSSDPHELNAFQNYEIDTAIPEHRINFNGIVDLPIGRGKRFFGGANRFVNELIGGYQIAGSGRVVSEYFGVSSSNWGPTNPLKVYNKKYKIQDCSSGVCHPGYQWFNGFINPLSINNPCGPNLYSGIPASNVSFQTPINMDPGTVTCTGSNGTTPKAGNPNYLTNIVQVPLANGTSSPVAYSPGPGLNPFSKSVLHSPTTGRQTCRFSRSSQSRRRCSSGSMWIPSTCSTCRATTIRIARPEFKTSCLLTTRPGNCTHCSPDLLMNSSWQE